MKKSTRKILLTGCVGLAALCVGGAFLNGAELSASASVKENVLHGFLIEETAGIRNVTPNGIRFTTNVDTDTKSTAKTLKDDGYTITYGALLCPTSLIGDELTYDTASVCDIPTTKWQNEDQTQYTSVLAGSMKEDGTYDDFLSSLYNTPISARGYMKATKGDETLYYYTENTAERSLAYVATMATLNGESSDLLSTIASTVTFGLQDITLSTDTTVGVVMYNANPVSASAVTLDGISATLPVGAVTYSVTDGTIVDVAENGVLTAKKAGTTTLTATYGTTTKTATITVTDKFVGKSDYTILLAANATEQEQTAANTLQKAFNKAGAQIAIKTETGNESAQGKYISIGDTKFASDFALTVTSDTASQVSTTGNAVLIKGKTDKGTLYGVQQWLGEAIDYDYFMKDTYAVTAKAVGLPTATSYTPAIEHNLIVNTNSDISLTDYGVEGFAEGVIQAGGNIHNSTLLLPYSEYGSSHSAWYAQVYKSSWQIATKTCEDELCYTAQGSDTEYQLMVEEVAAKLVAALQGDTTKTRVAFSVRDGNYQCKCSACKKKGNISDTFVPFLNDVCNAVQSKLTTAGDSRANTFKIVTLAYHQTNAAPTKITSLTDYQGFANHVELWFGDSYGDYTDGLENSSSTKNQEIWTNFQAWKTLIEGSDIDVLLWVYYSNSKNGFVPYNTFTAIRENYATAKNNGVDYVFNQTIQAKSGWTMLKHYLISQLAWNATPTNDEWNAWIDAYFTNAYGAGAEKMREWFNDWLDDDTSNYATSDGDPAIHRDMETKGNFPEITLNMWISYATAAVTAIEASDATEAEKNQYVNNVLLEKLSPEYFLIKLYGNTTCIEEFLKGVKTWNILYLGEGVEINATIKEFTAIKDANSITVNTPSASSYFNYYGNAYVVKEDDYTFTVTGKESRFDQFIVYANDELLTGNNGTYTVANVTDELTIKVVHPYIECGENASVTYTDNSIVFKMLESTLDNRGTRNMGWISADYINYMIDQGYTTIYGTVTLNDPTKANVGMVKSLEQINDTTTTYIDLSLWQQDNTYETSTTGGKSYPLYSTKKLTADLKFWLQLNTSAINITDVENGYMTVTNFYLAKADGTTFNLMPTKANVTKPVSSYFEVVGDDAVEFGKDYTFTVNNKVKNCTEYVVRVDGNVLTATSGVYTVPNVSKDFEIEILHGYIEHGANVTVTYNDDGSIVVKDATHANGNYEPYFAWISADYINYMIGKGYATISLATYPDDTVGGQACVNYNGKIFSFVTGMTAVTKSQELGESCTDNMYFWVQDHAGSCSTIHDKGGYMTITNLKFMKEQVSVTTPAESDYYTFSGANTVEKGGDYTFTVTSKDASKFNGFLVYANDELLTGNDGTYTVENVTEALTIKVVHGYIEHGSNVTVTYNDDGSIKIENAVYNTIGNEGNLPYSAWISKEYMNYMYAQGYKTISLTVTLGDVNTANQALIKSYIPNEVTYYDLSLWQDKNVTSLKQKTTTKELVNNCTVDLFFWLQKDNSGTTAKDKNPPCYMTITNLTFAKEQIIVTAPAESDYYTFNGTNTVEKGGDYTFTVTSKDASKFNGFLVYANDELLTGNNGTYTVENVTEALTIKVVHGYIEHGSNAKVTYNDDGSIRFEKIVLTDSTTASYGWISKEYINYMISQGYTKISATITVSDVNKVNQAMVTGGGISLSLHNGDNTYTKTTATTTQDLPASGVTDDLKFWLQHDGSGYKVLEGGYMTITGLTFAKETVSVTAPATNEYYTFTGDTKIAKGGAYGFTVKGTVENCNEFIVLANDTVVTGNNGAYIVTNVTEPLTIKVLHGYIEHSSEAEVSVTYNDDGSIVVKGAVWSGTARSAWISQDYINYMISQGYKTVTVTAQADGEHAVRICANYNGSSICFLYSTDGGVTTRTQDLGESCTADMHFWVQDGNGSGTVDVQQNGYMTITNLTFSK